MKLFTIVMLLSFSLSGLAAPLVVEAPVEHLFVPSGFDNNDHVEVIVTGKFPNPCYTRNSYKVKIEEDVINVNVSSLLESDSEQKKCEPLKVPFTEVISVGNLQGGDYKVVINGGGKHQIKETLSIATAQSQGVDDNIYAMVDYVDLGFTGGVTGEVFLVAQTPSSCLVFDRVEYISNKKDAISVMPIMKKLRSDCPESTERFEIPLKLDVSALKGDKFLVYVRTIEGRSVHSFVTR